MSGSNRSRIRSLVLSLPGIHMRQVQRILGLSFSSVRYNIDSLKKSREIIDWSQTGHSRLFPPEVSEWEKIVYSNLRSRSSRKILRAFSQHDKLTNRELAEITGYAKSTLSESTHRLLDEGILIISFSQEGRVAYQLKNPDRLLPMIRAADQTVLEEVTDRFIQLWDF
jgi:predicted transcriptional regulator